MLIAVAIFLVAYVIIATERLPRHWVALVGSALLIVFGILNPMEAFNYVNWETLGLLLGMFFLVAILIESGFFSWLSLTIVQKANYHPGRVFFLLPLVAALMATLMDSITVMLFFSALTYQLCKLLKIDPVPLIIAEVCAANIGGAATLVGDPPNVIIGTTLGFSFIDFLQHTGPVALIGAVVSTVYFYWRNYAALKLAHAEIDLEVMSELGLADNGMLKLRLMRVGLVFFSMAVVLLIAHHWLEEGLGIKISTATCALVPAGLAVLTLAIGDATTKVKSLALTLKRVDFESIVFFCGLFVLIGGLEKTYFMQMLAEGLGSFANGNPAVFLLSLHWFSGIASALVDNVPLALGMTYVLRDIARSPIAPALAIMVWALSLGVDMGGNMTPIGASANVVSYAFLEKNHGKVGWATWMKAAIPPTVISMLIASAFIVVKNLIGWY